MIPANAIIAWGAQRPWPTPEQVEQDLLLSRAICAIAGDEYLGAELVFRGGTALHKLHLDQPFRYSEDLDYVRRTAGGIVPLTQALTRLGESLRFKVNTRIGEHPKILWRAVADSGVPLRIKIEVNTHERSPVLPLLHHEHGVQSSWWTGSAAVQTFQPAEILAAFGPYRPTGMTGARARENLARKLDDRGFRTDLDPLVAVWPEGYALDTAAELIGSELLDRLDEDNAHPPT